ncbi:MAG TPA: Mut7-C RNAse domain-containing protein [Terriglobales bacterium]|nr:Mut7-C RNAse domain-containing protein [Terriglobales bacterium]
MSKTVSASAPRRYAVFRYYAELNDFLPPERRFNSFRHDFELSGSVKDAIESMGVPHTEVELILCKRTPVDFSHLVQDGDQISVYPAFRTLDLSPVLQLRAPLRTARFVIDTHLGRLATYLRMLGFDAFYERTLGDKELSRISQAKERILLTRDCGLLKRSAVVYGYFVRATDPKQQVIEVLRRYNLFSAASPFQRCLRCNVRLQPVSKDSIARRLQPKTSQHFEEFRICTACGRIYWAGSHYEHMQRFVQDVLAHENVCKLPRT